jgi:putative DNA primase/helicase
MGFLQFAEMHGLKISSLIMDRWVRVPTEDHPHKKNGSYIFDGISGAVKNWAVHEKAISWHSKEAYRPDPQLKIKREKAEKERLDRQEKAATRAGMIMKSAVLASHPYLDRKGFKDKGYVWNDLLVLPMRIQDKLVGCQLISQDGTKRFLAGQVTKGASLTIDNKGRDILCEGFATALSVKKAMKAMKLRYTIHVCFSASNMLEIAKTCINPLVIADNDPVGIKTANKIGKYWISNKESEDFNDYEQRVGTEAASKNLHAILQNSL